MEKSSSVGSSCFMTDWFHLPTKMIHGLILIIAVSNNPAKISAGRIVDLSLSTFGGVSLCQYLNSRINMRDHLSLIKANLSLQVLKSSLAYLSFLRTTIM
ncbi:hypothetical protein K0M31_017776 [Melipona bicolor]|uniref:Uncharacterized protein n=1 Tax=Melipona bicolor TaxID=60889 RepID=A0AA40G5P8_9HYME|nr:hypothetical protein K0M31_017776 [Melipona bicolor]